MNPIVINGTVLCDNITGIPRYVYENVIRLDKLIEGTGLDAWVVQREVQDPAEYAETWARDGGHHPGTADFNRMYAAWLDDFASRDVRAIGDGTERRASLSQL